MQYWNEFPCEYGKVSGKLEVGAMYWAWDKKDEGLSSVEVDDSRIPTKKRNVRIGNKMSHKEDRVCRFQRIQFLCIKARYCIKDI